LALFMRDKPLTELGSLSRLSVQPEKRDRTGTEIRKLWEEEGPKIPEEDLQCAQLEANRRRVSDLSGRKGPGSV
ncbi:hypothetical protein, partial [Faecalibaculum rodentium]|uniref:hypothetical protein n=1 Tax=Faecalibaculum rodentium TaxID=1702221 RepID=UPI0025B1D91D